MEKLIVISSFLALWLTPALTLCIMAFNRGLPSVFIGPIFLWSFFFAMAIAGFVIVGIKNGGLAAGHVPITLIIALLVYWICDAISAIKRRLAELNQEKSVGG